MLKRTVTVLVLAVIGLPAILFGGIFYYLLVATFLVGAAYEYANLFQVAKYRPSFYITIAGTGVISITRMFFPEYAQASLSLSILVAMAYHLITYERGRDQAAIDFGITVGGIVYIGWLGSYLLDLRNLPNGGWWLMLVMCCVWAGDSGAYLIGKAYGRHKMAPRLSPNKSWEGYIASVFSGMIFGVFFVYAFTNYGSPAGQVTLWQGAILGLILGSIPPLGDLGESMIKRQSGIKDSSDIIPGHGGFFDRIDSWLWGAVIGYYFLVWFII
jgi:phosphatidate cytidylyltransferase